ncbi:sigma-70 family RNA polymerase sigma factor [Kitasatospora atroaurantiaca]|uniref:RNA polymerase sigma factor (Sigma-70 family) n=1 Tax=Kitasatospora atroaurantiaca TaxID=285545 RepID=A0A561EZ98_9ACTN|nr:sigma-70 family RNA polymerase sigma factor [Kitasatospora atroaurantiaca]TWE20931.1 RNA polymerase sigma factor (sigma-70 family) [Kitasatospora atroaurantiaca]
MVPVAELRPELAAFLTVLARGRRLDAEEVEQAVWLRVVERSRAGGLPRDRRAWLRGIVVREVLAAGRYTRVETPVGRVPQRHRTPEEHLLAAERRRAVRRALARLPGRCPQLMTALAESPELTYRQLADELGVPRGSIGPTRSRCLACLRALLQGHRP